MRLVVFCVSNITLPSFFEFNQNSQRSFPLYPKLDRRVKVIVIVVHYPASLLCSGHQFCYLGIKSSQGFPCIFAKILFCFCHYLLRAFQDPVLVYQALQLVRVCLPSPLCLGVEFSCFRQFHLLFKSLHYVSYSNVCNLWSMIS